MLKERLQWLGGLVVAEVGTWIAWKQVAAGLPWWSQWVAVGVVGLGFLLYYPYAEGVDGSVHRPINFRQRGRGNVAFTSGDSSPASGNITNTGPGKQTVNNHGLTVEQLSELRKHVDDRIVDKVEIYVDRRMEAFKTEVVKITGEAHTQAIAMGKYVIGGFMEQLAERAPANIKSLGTADMQHAILNAQSSAAITDDKELADTLVDILVDKSGTEPRSFKSVVLNEALAVASKLTPDQINLLTALLILERTVVPGASTIDQVLEMLDSRCRPLYGKIPTSENAFQYMIYTGVGSIERVALLTGRAQIAKSIVNTYDAVFTRGFQADELPDGLKVTAGTLAKVDSRITGDEKNRLRIPIASSQTLDVYARDGVLKEPYLSHKDEAKQLITKNRTTPEKLMEIVEADKPLLAKFFRELDEIQAATFELSSVGIALGQANWRRLLPNDAPEVDIWLR